MLLGIISMPLNVLRKKYAYKIKNKKVLINYLLIYLFIESTGW